MVIIKVSLWKIEIIQSNIDFYSSGLHQDIAMKIL